MTDSVLKPCPFCEFPLVDIADRYSRDKWGDRHFEGYSCCCRRCAASGPEKPTEAEATAAWNIRAQSAEIERLRAAAQSALRREFGWGSKLYVALAGEGDMSYWCDDRHLLTEQRRLDAEQQRAAEKIKEALAKYGKPNAKGHITRFSDSSLYDETCVLCGMVDGSLMSPVKHSVDNTECPHADEVRAALEGDEA